MKSSLEILIAFSISTAILAITPGPDNMYVLVQSMVHGKKYGLATVAGLLTGCIVHTALVAFGVSVLIRQNEFLFLILKVAGAGYLFFLAYQVWKHSSEIVIGTSEVPKKSLWALYKQGILMNLLNPKVAIFFLAFFPGFLFSSTLKSEIQFFVLGGIFIAVSFLIFSGIAILAGFVSSLLDQNKSLSVVFKWLQIIVFVSIGIFILFSKK